MLIPPLLLLLLVQGTTHVLANNNNNSSRPLTLPLTRHYRPSSDLEKRVGPSAYLRNYRNSLFSIPVNIGTRRDADGQDSVLQTFQLVVDTGSPFMYVYSHLCQGQDPGSQVFHSSRSQTFIVNGPAYTSAPGMSEITGLWGLDWVGFGHSAGLDDQVPVEKQDFINALEVIREPWVGMGLDYVPDGTIGFAPPSPQHPDKSPLWYRMMNDPLEVWTLPMFSIYLRRSYPYLTREDHGGEIALGGINDECVSDPPNWNNVVDGDHGHWQIKLDRLQIGEDELPIEASTDTAIIDTGSTLMYGPPKDVKAFYDALALDMTVYEEDGRYRLKDVSVFEEFRHVSFIFNDHEYEIPHTELWYKGEVPGSGEIAYYGILEDSSEDNWIIGTPLLSNVYTSFHMPPEGPPQVGFSTLKRTLDGGYACG